MVYVLDTLGYTRKLEAAGVPRDHAEAHAEAIHEYIMSTVATKDDVNAAVATLSANVASLRAEFYTELKTAVATLSANDASIRADLEKQTLSLKSDIDKLSLTLTVRLGTFIFVVVGSFVALGKLF